MPNSFPQPLVEEIKNYAQNIVDTVREPLLILDATLRVRSANRAFYQTFQVSAAEASRGIEDIYELTYIRKDRAEAGIKRVLAEGKVTDYERNWKRL